MPNHLIRKLRCAPNRYPSQEIKNHSIIRICEMNFHTSILQGRLYLSGEEHNLPFVATLCASSARLRACRALWLKRSLPVKPQAIISKAVKFRETFPQDSNWTCVWMTAQSFAFEQSSLGFVRNSLLLHRGSFLPLHF